MKPIKALFSTYSTVSNDLNKTAFLGVLKRCLRLINNLGPAKVESHLLNFGCIPENDPLVQESSLNIIRHDYHKDSDFFPLFERIKPDVVVLGEGPGSGNMLKFSRAALKAGIPQICIENYYHTWQPEHYRNENPWLDHWFLLGLPLRGAYGEISERTVLVPTLLPMRKSKEENNKRHVLILGYDQNVAELGIKLIKKLPEDIETTLIHSKLEPETFYKLKMLSGPDKINFRNLPKEEELVDLIHSSRFVICKNGFQQISECLAINTPVIVYDAPGGVPHAFLSQYFQPYVRYFPKKEKGWSMLSLQAAMWLEERPKMPWIQTVEEIQNPLEYAASEFLKILKKLTKREVHSVAHGVEKKSINLQSKGQN